MQARPSRCPAQLVSLCSHGGGSAPPSGPAWVCTRRSQQPYSWVPLVLAGLITGVQGSADWVLVSDCVQCDTLAEHRPEQQKTRSCAFCFDEGMWEEVSRLLKKIINFWCICDPVFRCHKWICCEFSNEMYRAAIRHSAQRQMWSSLSTRPL